MMPSHYNPVHPDYAVMTAHRPQRPAVYPVVLWELFLPGLLTLPTAFILYQTGLWAKLPLEFQWKWAASALPGALIVFLYACHRSRKAQFHGFPGGSHLVGWFTTFLIQLVVTLLAVGMVFPMVQRALVVVKMEAGMTGHVLNNGEVIQSANCTPTSGVNADGVGLYACHVTLSSGKAHDWTVQWNADGSLSYR